MATFKVTFTLDEPALRSLEAASAQLHKSKSEVVRDAIVEYRARMGRLSESERIRMLRALDEYAKIPPTKTNADVDRELAEIRRARGHGGRKTRAE